MKIVLYVNSFLPAIGGREIVVYYLARALKERGHDVRVVGSAGWWKHRKLKYEFPVHRYPVLKGRFSSTVRFLQLLFDVVVYGADVINAHATYPSGYHAGKLKRIMKIPVVVTPHGGDILAVPEIGYGDRLDPEINKKIEDSLRTADRVTAISNTIRDAAIRVVGDTEKVTVVPNGIDDRRLALRAPVDVHGWLGIPARSRLIMTVGNYHPCKGQENIIRAMKKVCEIEPDAVLVIVGRNTDALKPLIQKLGLDEKIVLTGRIEFPSQGFQAPMEKEKGATDWLAAIYQQAGIYVSAGINDGAEGLSLAVLDAMGAGLAVVGSNISGNKDVISDNVSGLLVTPNDVDSLAQAITKLLGDDGLRQRLGGKAREHARKYFWGNIAKQYEAVYRSVCQSE